MSSGIKTWLLCFCLAAFLATPARRADAMVRPLPSVNSDSSSIVRQVFADIHGNVVGAVDVEWIDFNSAYSAFGVTGPLSEYVNTPSYSTRRMDETGLIYFGARYFDPVTGRFISPDPSRFADSRNLYALAGNDPINGRDPDGRLAAGVGKGAVMGDYAEYGNGAQAVGGFFGQVGVGFTPAGVAGDIRDFTAAANDLKSNGLGWRTGIGVGLATVAFVPGVGDALKGIFKPLLRVADDVPVKAIVNIIEEDAGKIRLPCFAAGTQVSTPDGDVKIEDIKPGDKVIAYDQDNGTVTQRKVLNTFTNFTYYWVDVRIGTETIRATRFHKFWIESERAWVDAVNLETGMVVRLQSGQQLPIQSVEVTELEKPEITYNLLVETDHTYHVGIQHVLVHNGYPVSPQYPPPTQVGENFQFNFDTSPRYRNSRNAGVAQALQEGYIQEGQIGHHINSVKVNPNLAAEPSNIQGVNSIAEHLEIHNGNFRNPTTGPLNVKPGC